MESEGDLATNLYLVIYTTHKELWIFSCLFDVAKCTLTLTGELNLTISELFDILVQLVL